MNQSSKKSSQRSKALIWLLLTIGVIGALLYFEQVAVIYVLSTIALIVLLIVVAFADLEKVTLGDQSADSDMKTKQPKSET